MYVLEFECIFYGCGPSRDNRLENGIQTGELVITNQSNGYVLPETGGAGTIPYTAGGLALLALAGLMYSTLRRKGEDAP